MSIVRERNVGNSLSSLFTVICIATLALFPASTINAQNSFTAGLTEPGTNEYPAFESDGVANMAAWVENSLDCAVITPDGSAAYFGTGTTPGRVVKVDLEAFGREAAITLPLAESNLRSAVIDPAGDFAYFGTDTHPTSPGMVVKVALQSFERVGSIMLDEEENSLTSAAIDSAGQFAYFGTNTRPAHVVKIDLTTFERVGAITLEEDEGGLLSAAIDPADAFAYFGTAAEPAKIVKVSLDPFERVDAIEVTNHRLNIRTAEIHPDATTAYFGAAYTFTGITTPPSSLIRVDLEGFAVVDSIAFTEGTPGFAVLENRLYATALSPDGSRLFVGAYGFFSTGTIGGSWDTNGRIIEVDTATFSRGNTVEVATRIRSAAIDPAGKAVYFGTEQEPGRVAKITLSKPSSQHGVLKATRFTMPEFGQVQDVRLYSHAADGNVRLSIYDDSSPKQLLWRSGVVVNTAAEDFLVVAIGSGTPDSLMLPPGDYWAAWQVDTDAPVPSLTMGNHGEGFRRSMEFGPAPSTLSSFGHTITPERWTQFVTYQPTEPEPGTTAFAFNSSEFSDDDKRWNYFVLPEYAGGAFGSYDFDGERLVTTTTRNDNVFGFWQSPTFLTGVVPPGSMPERTVFLRTLTGEPTLQTIWTASTSSSTDPAFLPTIRLRASSFDHQLVDEIQADSRGIGGVSPSPEGRVYRQYFQLPANQDRFRLNFDVLNFDPNNLEVAFIALDEVVVETADLDALGAPETVEVFDFMDGADHGFTLRTGPPLHEPVHAAPSEMGLAIRGADEPTNETIFGYFGRLTDVRFDASRVYRLTWVLASDADPEEALHVPAARIRVNDGSLQLTAVQTVTSFQETARVPTAGNPQTYSMLFDIPEAVDGHRMILSFDYISADLGNNHPSQDDPTITLLLESVVIETYGGS